MGNVRLHIILDNVRSVYNVGSVFRTSDAVGGVKIYLCGITPTPENPKISKTALGSVENVEWQYFSKTSEAILEIKKENVPVYAVELTPLSVHFQKMKYNLPVAFVFGHERRGVDAFVLDMCDGFVQVPMNGMKESLNVSTTAGIIMYEAIR